jgi:hypothetical protein
MTAEETTSEGTSGDSGGQREHSENTAEHSRIQQRRGDQWLGQVRDFEPFAGPEE